MDKESLRLKSVQSDQSENNYLDQSFNLLQESKEKLQHIVNEKYDLAFKKNDIPELERFFKIFPLVGLANDGLEKFSTYLCIQIKQAADRNYSELLSMSNSDKRWNIMFADALILLFEKVARVIEAYQPLIESYYGHGHMFLFIKNIQKECDLQSVKILKKFKEVRNLDFILRSIKQSQYMVNSSLGGKPEDKIDPRDLDELLTEMTLISARCELYKNFLQRSITNDVINLSTEQQKAKMNETNAFINSTNLECSIQELIGQYSSLENYFMTENILKAIQMDTFLKDSLTSSVVDDVFFIIKKCIK